MMKEMSGTRRLRVREYRSRRTWEGYQVLQEKRWWGWKSIARAEIPSHALISLGALGYSGWVSPFAEHIKSRY